MIHNIIIKSTNEGNNWTNILTTTGSLNSVFFTQTNTGYVIGDFGKILKTINGGSIFVGINSDNEIIPDS